VEEMMQECGVTVAHSPRNRWVITYALEIEKPFRRRKRPVGKSWRRDEPSIRVKGEGKYVSRTVDREGQTIDFLLTPQRDRAAAAAFLHKAIRAHGVPEKITIDRSGANTAAIMHDNTTHKTATIIRHSKYLNNIVEQDPRAAQRITRPTLCFKSFWTARCTMAGMEVRHALRKEQLVGPQESQHTPAEQFYALAA
jgi:putative transposase